MLRRGALPVLLGCSLLVIFAIAWGWPHEQGQIIGDPLGARVCDQLLCKSDLVLPGHGDN